MADPPQAQQTRQLDLNLDYFKTPAGQLRVAQGVLSLIALILSAEALCPNDGGRFAFYFFFVVLTMLEAIVVVIIFILNLDKKVTVINLPLTFLLNDSINCICYFINSNLALLSVGRCHYRIGSRVVASLFTIALFLVYAGLIYTDYNWWKLETSSKQKETNGSTTITESSPTVLA